MNFFISTGAGHGMGLRGNLHWPFVLIPPPPKKKSGITFLIVMWFALVSRAAGFWFEDGMFDSFDKTS